MDLEHVSGCKPVIFMRILRRDFVAPVLVDVSGDVGSCNLEFALRGEANLDAGERNPDSTVNVLPGRSHRDAACSLRHAEAAAKINTILLKEVENLRVQVAGRREPPAQAVSDDAPEYCFLIAGRTGISRVLEPVIADLRSVQRYADQAGRMDFLQLGNQRFKRGVPGKHERRPPVKRAKHLEVAPECVEQRQVAEKNLMIADGRQRGSAGKSLGDEMVKSERYPFGSSGAPGGEHHSCDIGEWPLLPPAQKILEGIQVEPRTSLLEKLAIDVVRQSRSRAGHENLDRSARAGTRFLEAQNSFFRIGNDDVDAKTVEDPGHAGASKWILSGVSKMQCTRQARSQQALSMLFSQKIATRGSAFRRQKRPARFLSRRLISA